MKRDMLNVILLLAMIFLMTAVKGEAGDGERPPMPPARQVPGITTKDMFPNACVDCHINRPEINLDVRLSSVMKPWIEQVDQKILAQAQASTPRGVTLKGKHPEVGDAFKNIPSSCMECHGKASKQTPSFPRMLHIMHLTGGGENPFITQFQAECTHCHKFNQITGTWSIPSAPEK